MAFGFLKKIVQTAGKVAMAPANLVAKGASKIPVIGKPLAAAVNLGNAPIALVNSVAQGERIDHAVLNNIKTQVKEVKEVAPYAKMVVSLVPGVGTAVAAAIAAGAALAEGQSITSALLEGVKGAIPGGALAQAAFSVSADLVQGKSVSDSVVNAIPMSETQKVALKTTVTLAKDLAAGKNISKPALEAAKSQLPPDVQNAINIGTAMGFAANIQNPGTVITETNEIWPPARVKNIQFTIPSTPMNGASPTQKLRDDGKKLADVNPVLSAGINSLSSINDKNGVWAAIGMMANNVTEAEVNRIHSLLDKTWENGFNIGCAAVIGLKHIKLTGDNVKDFGYAVAWGLDGASDELKVAAVKTIGTNPKIQEAVLHVAAIRKNWFYNLLAKLHLVQ